MSYRADDEARRQRIEALETELARARTDHAKATAIERESEEQKSTLETRIAGLEKELAEARREPAVEPAVEPPSPPSAKTKRSWWSRTKEAFAFLPLVGVVLGFGTCVVCTVEENRPSCAAIDDHVELRWSAEVTTVDGVNVPVGERCEVRSAFFADRDGELYIESAELEIECGSRVVFESDDGGYGCQVSQTRSADRWRYAIPNCSFSRDGVTVQWAGPGMTIASTEPSWQIGLAVAPEASASVSLYDREVIGARLTQPFESNAVVIVLSGTPPVALGDRCTVSVAAIDPSSSGDENCHATVRCGERTLRSAPAECEVEDGRPITANAPGIEIDVARGVARVSESSGPGDPYLASLQLVE